MKNKKELLIGLLVVIDFVLLAFMVFFGVSLLHDIVGYDCVIYENWDGALENPTVYRFGAGCWEYTILIFEFLLFTVLQIFLAVKYKFRIPLVIVGLFLHLVILVLGLAYIFKFGDGGCLLIFRDHFIYNIDY